MCGGNVDLTKGVCPFCGTPLTSEKKIAPKITKNFQQEPRSEANVEDVTSFLSSSVKVASDILSGDALNFVADAGKVVSDFQNIQNDSKKKKNVGQKLTRESEDLTPYYMKPGGFEEPKDESPAYNIADRPEMKETPQMHQFINMNPTHPIEESLFKDKEPLQLGGQYGEEVEYKYPYIRSGVQDDVKMGTQFESGTLAKPESRIQVPTRFRVASTPLFIAQNSISQIIMSAFEVLPKETFGLLFGLIKDQKIIISSVQPSQEAQRGEAYVQPQKEAIDRLESLKDKISSTNLIGSYHSHVYLERQEVASLEEGASLSKKDAENLLSSQWRQVAIIVGYFSSQAWGLPVQDTNWRRDSNSLICDKTIQAQGRTGFHIRISPFIKERGQILKVPIYLSGEIRSEGARSLCSICGGEVQGGVCKHCGSRLE